jgi:hypothetical protein
MRLSGAVGERATPNGSARDLRIDVRERESAGDARVDAAGRGSGGSRKVNLDRGCVVFGRVVRQAFSTQQMTMRRGVVSCDR